MIIVFVINPNSQLNEFVEREFYFAAAAIGSVYGFN